MEKPKARSEAWIGAKLSGGRYRIVKKLGEGAMGGVFTAHDQNLDAEVVIKIPHESALTDPDFAPRFDREIRALVKLRHPHIVKLFDVGNYDGIPYMVMDYHRGGDMEQRRTLRSDGSYVPLSPATIADWLPQIADALDYAHAKGYLHRDIKPTNILFDDNHHAYLSDFGVVGALAGIANTPAPTRAMTAAGLVLGTPQYMAPEILMGEPTDGRADQYSLGIMAYELLAGRRPFESANVTALIVQQSTQSPPPIRQFVPELSEGLAAVIHQALEKDPARRFADCKAFAAAAMKEAWISASSNYGYGLAPGQGSTQAQPKPATAKATRPNDSGSRSVVVNPSSLPVHRRSQCPACRGTIKVTSKMVGKKQKCSNCGSLLEVTGTLEIKPVAGTGSHDDIGAANAFFVIEQTPPPGSSPPLPPSSPSASTKTNTNTKANASASAEGIVGDLGVPSIQLSKRGMEALLSVRASVYALATAVALIIVAILVSRLGKSPPDPGLASADPRTATPSKSIGSGKRSAAPSVSTSDLPPEAGKTIADMMRSVSKEREKSETKQEADKPILVRSRPDLDDGQLVDERFNTYDIREGELPEGWEGNLKVAKALGKPFYEMALMAGQTGGTVQPRFPVEKMVKGDFECTVKFLVPSGKAFEPTLRLIFNPPRDRRAKPLIVDVGSTGVCGIARLLDDPDDDPGFTKLDHRLNPDEFAELVFRREGGACALSIDNEAVKFGDSSLSVANGYTGPFESVTLELRSLGSSFSSGAGIAASPRVRSFQLKADGREAEPLDSSSQIAAAKPDDDSTITTKGNGGNVSRLLQPGSSATPPEMGFDETFEEGEANGTITKGWIVSGNLNSFYVVKKTAQGKAMALIDPQLVLQAPFVDRLLPTPFAGDFEAEFTVAFPNESSSVQVELLAGNDQEQRIVASIDSDKRLKLTIGEKIVFDQKADRFWRSGSGLNTIGLKRHAGRFRMSVNGNDLTKSEPRSQARFDKIGFRIDHVERIDLSGQLHSIRATALETSPTIANAAPSSAVIHAKGGTAASAYAPIASRPENTGGFRETFESSAVARFPEGWGGSEGARSAYRVVKTLENRALVTFDQETRDKGDFAEHVLPNPVEGDFRLSLEFEFPNQYAYIEVRLSGSRGEADDVLLRVDSSDLVELFAGKGKTRFAKEQGRATVRRLHTIELNRAGSVFSARYNNAPLFDGKRTAVTSPGSLNKIGLKIIRDDVAKASAKIFAVDLDTSPH